MEFVHKLRGEQAGIQLPAALSQQSLYLPARGKPMQGEGEINPVASAHHNFIRDRRHGSQSFGSRLFRGEEHEGRGAIGKKPAREIHPAATGHHDAEMGFGKAPAPSGTTESGGAGVEYDIPGNDRAGAAHDGVGGGAEFVEMGEIAGATEGGDATVGGGDLAIGGHRHVDEDERAGGMATD